MRVLGVRSGASLGIAAYCERLSASLAATGLDYETTDAPRRGEPNHLHLGNSSRSVVAQAARLRGRFVVTVHDVVPRDPRLMPAYKALVYPLVVRRAAALVVHSAVAADMLTDVAGVRPGAIQVIPHPVTRPRDPDRAAARSALGWGDEVVAVLPGVLKSAKLVGEALAGGVDIEGLRLVLSGRVGDPALVAAARRAGATVVADPDDATYERAVVGADMILVLRDGSVGETNGPLLDALGAGRAVIATRSGSIPEVAEDAAIYVRPEAAAIRAAIARAMDGAERVALEARSVERARVLSPEAAASAHVQLFREVFGAP